MFARYVRVGGVSRLAEEGGRVPERSSPPRGHGCPGQGVVSLSGATLRSSLLRSTSCPPDREEPDKRTAAPTGQACPGHTISTHRYERHGCVVCWVPRLRSLQPCCLRSGHGCGQRNRGTRQGGAPARPDKRTAACPGHPANRERKAGAPDPDGLPVEQVFNSPQASSRGDLFAVEPTRPRPQVANATGCKPVPPASTDTSNRRD